MRLGLSPVFKAGVLNFLTLPLTSALLSFHFRKFSPVFVVSSGRTGTRTLIEFLKPAPGVWALHEPRPHGAELSKLAHDDISGNREYCMSRFARYRAWRLYCANLVGKTYVESTNMQFIMPDVAALMPRARFVVMHRHPAEFVRSGVRRGWYHDHPWDPYRIVPRAGQAAHEYWTQWGPFEKVCWQWAEVNDFLFSFRQSLPAERCFTLKFEDFVSDTDGVLRERMLDFMGLTEEDKRILKGQELPHSNRQLEGVFPELADWSPERRMKFDEIVGPTMARLGYDRVATA